MLPHKSMNWSVDRLNEIVYSTSKTIPLPLTSTPILPPVDPQRGSWLEWSPSPRALGILLFNPLVPGPCSKHRWNSRGPLTKLRTYLTNCNAIKMPGPLDRPAWEGGFSFPHDLRGREPPPPAPGRRRSLTTRRRRRSLPPWSERRRSERLAQVQESPSPRPEQCGTQRRHLGAVRSGGARVPEAGSVSLRNWTKRQTFFLLLEASKKAISRDRLKVSPKGLPL